MVAERYVERVGFADYSFTVSGTPALILEAKKTDATFALSGFTYPNRSVPFAMLHDHCPAAAAAMRQAVGYAASTGSVFTAISNGHQWIVMLTHVLGVPIDQRQVIIFESLDAILSKFPVFWRCFAPVEVAVSAAYSSLLDSRRSPAPAKLSSRIRGYPIQRQYGDLRNQHATALQFIWDEVNNNEDTPAFFEHCYVEPLGHEKNKGLATELLAQRLRSDELVVPT